MQSLLSQWKFLRSGLMTNCASTSCSHSTRFSTGVPCTPLRPAITHRTSKMPSPQTFRTSMLIRNLVLATPWQSRHQQPLQQFFSLIRLRKRSTFRTSSGKSTRESKRNSRITEELSDTLMWTSMASSRSKSSSLAVSSLASIWALRTPATCSTP